MVRHYSPQLPPVWAATGTTPLGQLVQLLWLQLSLGFGNTILFIPKAIAPSTRPSPVAIAFPWVQ